MAENTKSVAPAKQTASSAPAAPAPVAAPAPATKSFYKFNTAVAAATAREEISKAAQSVSNGGKGGGRGKPSLNICCAEGNRKSIKLSKSLYEGLFGEIDEDSDPRELQVLRDGMNLYLSEEFPEDTDSFPFSSATSLMVYNAALVFWMVDAFNLDFSKGRTSRSFQNIEIVIPEKGSTDKPYCIIDMSKPLKK